MNLQEYPDSYMVKHFVILNSLISQAIELSRLKLGFFKYVYSSLISSVLVLQLSCIDCGVVFDQQSVQAHTSCVTETVMHAFALSFCFILENVCVSARLQKVLNEHISQTLTQMLTCFQGLYCLVLFFSLVGYVGNFLVQKFDSRLVFLCRRNMDQRV